MANKFDELLEQFGSNTESLNETVLVDKKYLEEQKRKAKAWEEFKEEKIKRYMGLRTLIMKGYGDALDTYYLGVFSDELKQMDELDGTNDFINLLNDLEDE